MRAERTAFAVTKQPEPALLVGFQDNTVSEARASELLKELESLVLSIGLTVTGSVLVKLREPHPRYFVGSGKAEEIAAAAKACEAEFIVFDNELSPSQQRNWEQLTGLSVLDRTEVILEIFAHRASTKEAELQVELARLEYSLPRLTRAWMHLSRQRGGAKGTRGEGETQLELDRRIVVRKIARLKAELLKVKQQRATQRKKRQSIPVPSVAVVGYTNAGKSSLLNSLTGASVLVEDKLFATLDPTTKRITLPGGRELLVTDTVGFIRKLPHQLIESFHATLEETVRADFLVHVIDISNKEMEEHIKTSLSVLETLHAANKSIITVFNKIDLASPFELDLLRTQYPDAVFVSTRTGDGLGVLLAALEHQLERNLETIHFLIPIKRYDAASLIHRTGKVISEGYEDEHIHIEALVPLKTRKLLEDWIVREV